MVTCPVCRAVRTGFALTIVSWIFNLIAAVWALAEPHCVRRH
jgi:hypothetical protein